MIRWAHWMHVGGSHELAFPGDVQAPLWRRAAGKKGALLAARLVEGQSSIVRKLGRDRACTVGFGRFLSNPAVMSGEVFSGSAVGRRATGAACSGDPGYHAPELSASRRGRSWARRRRSGSGSVCASGAGAGCGGRDGAGAGGRSGLDPGCGEGAATALGVAGGKGVGALDRGGRGGQGGTGVGPSGDADRESDIYEEWAALPGLGFDLITRASRDRKLVGEQRLFTVAEVWPMAAHRGLDVRARKGRPARHATLAPKYGTVSLCRARHCSTPGLPQTLALHWWRSRNSTRPKVRTQSTGGC